MATSKEYKEFILEQLDLLNNITCIEWWENFYCIVIMFYLVEFMIIDYLLK